MKCGTLTFLIVFTILCKPASGQDLESDWLSLFLTQLDSESEVARNIAKLGPDPARETVIASAANHFRSRAPLTSLWVIPLDAAASQQDFDYADKAINHIITDRSGEFPLPDKLPWFDAPEKLITLSRFPHFDYLARSYRSTQDEKYAEAMVRDMLDFIDNVPLSRSSEYHVQYPANKNPWNWVLLQWRVKRWIDVLAHLRQSPSLTDEDYLRILQYTWNEVDWLVPNKNIGLHNGTLGNGSTILYASLHYPEAKSSTLWQNDATALLDAFLDMAFYPREFLIELTLGYSEGTLLMCSSMFEALPESPAKERIKPKLESIFDAHIGMMKPDRSIPRYGDHGIYDIRERLLRKGDRLFQRPDLAIIAEQPEQKFRSDGRLSFPYESNPYYLSGYYAMRSGWDEDAQYLSMDAGPFGTNHHHGDKLSITLSADGAEFIVDPGTSLYTSAEAGPRYDLRYGFLHNVITIDGVDPNTGWDRHYGFDVLENRWVTNATYDFLEGTYEFRNNLLDAMWRRSVFFVKGDYWIMLDTIYGEGEHLVESNLQFMIGNDVEVAGNRATAEAAEGAALDLVQVFGDELESSVVIGDTLFPGTTYLTQYPTFVDWIPGGRGWVGMFGNETPLDPVKSYPAPALVKSGTIHLPFKMATVLTPSIDKSGRQATVRVINNDERRFTIEITTDSNYVDLFSWQLADWPDRTKKIRDDSGWWARMTSDGVGRIIVMNEDSLMVTTDQESIALQFDGLFEGVVERTTSGWTITPDAYHAETPRLLSFMVSRGDDVQLYRVSTGQELTPEVETSLVRE